MGILQKYKEGNMDGLRSINYSETGTQPPYVIKDIKDPPNNNDKTIGLQFNKRIDDTARITQMLVKKPGLKWIGNQALLDNANLQRKAKAAADKKRGQEGGATNAGIALAAAGASAAQVAKVVGSTLAQVPVNGTGTHFVRGFTPDTYLKQGDPNGILGFLGFNDDNGASKALNGETIISDNDGSEGYNNLYPSEIKDKQSKFSSLEPLLKVDNRELAKQGKPILGTTIVPGPVPLVTNLSSNTTSQIENSVENTITGSYDKNSASTKIIDFRNPNSENNFGSTTTSNSGYLDYGSSTINKETRVGLGNQGKKKGPFVTYTQTDPDSIDTINALAPKDEKTKGTATGEESSRDFIKFNFQVVTPDTTKFLYFRAFLTQFDDSFNGSWDTTKYLGRAENFYTYQGFERNINIGFIISAATREEMKPLYQKMAYLASSTAPTYGNDGKFMRGSLVKVTVGDYIYEVPGILESVNYTWDTQYTWEIAMQNPEGNADGDMQELPHTMNCALSFKPIHSFVPETGLLPYITNPTPGKNKTPFIVNA